jgi:hypothetical protein
MRRVMNYRYGETHTAYGGQVSVVMGLSGLVRTNDHVPSRGRFLYLVRLIRGGTMQTQEMEHGKKVTEKSRYELIEGVFERVEALSPRTFATAAALSVGSSLLLRLMGRRHDAIFVGEWAPTLLMMGLYTKAMSEARRGLSEGTGARGSSGEVAH